MRNDAVVADAGGNRDIRAGSTVGRADVAMFVPIFVIPPHVRAVGIVVMSGRLDRHVPIVANAQHRRLRGVQRRQRQ